MNFTIDMMQLIFATVGIGLTVVFNTWAVVRYLIGRIDTQGVDVNSRISQLRDSAVMRKEYDREMQRLHSEVAAVRDAVGQYGNNHTARIDALIIALGASKP